MCLFLCVSILAACSSDGKKEAPVLSRTLTLAAGSICSQGGIKIETGRDYNHNGSLQTSEVGQAEYRCNGNGQVTSRVIAGTEASGKTHIEFKLAEPMANRVSFDYQSSDNGNASGDAIAGVDYEAANGTVTFAPGETLKTIAFVVHDNNQQEGGKTFTVTLSNPENAVLANTTVSVLIIDDDLSTINLQQTELQTIEEKAEVITLTVELSAPQSIAVNQGFDLAGTAVQGQDYTLSANAFSLPANTQQASITLTILNDNLAENTETIELTLQETGNAVLGSSNKLVVNIVPRLAQIAAGQRHACAVTEDKAVKCWGNNANSQLGILAAGNRGASLSQLGAALPTVDLGSSFTVSKMGLGNQHSCVLSDTGQVKCWGRNSSGQLGQDNSVNIGAATISNPNLDLGAAEDNEPEGSCAEVNKATLPGTCLFGDNLPVIKLGTGLTARQVVAGAEHTCALLNTNKVKCWGGNRFGQLGNDSQESIGDGQVPNPNYDAENGSSTGTDICQYTNIKYLPISCSNVANTEMGDSLAVVALAGDVKLLAAGDYHTCAVLNDNRVQCWGLNSSGQLGLGDNNDRGDGMIPNPQFNPTGSNSGNSDECNTVTSRFIPLSCDASISTEMGASLTPLNFGRVVEGISAGLAHSCVLLADKSTVCWGTNSRGQLGLGNTQAAGLAQAVDNTTTAANLGSGLTAEKLFTGSMYNCATLNGSGLKCWGDNSSGQLGLGDTANRGVDANTIGDRLDALSLPAGNLLNMALGRDFSCALLEVNSENRAYCWGSGSFGQLGAASASNITDSSQAQPLKVF